MRGTDRRSFVLIAVLTYILLATSLVLVTAASTGQLVRTGRDADTRILLRQLTDSAAAWCLSHASELGDTPVTLDAGGILPEGMTGHVTVRLPGTAGNEVEVEATLNRTDRRFIRMRTYTIPKAAP